MIPEYKVSCESDDKNKQESAFQFSLYLTQRRQQSHNIDDSNFNLLTCTKHGIWQ